MKVKILGGAANGQYFEGVEPLPESITIEDIEHHLRHAAHIVLSRDGSRGCPYVEDPDGSIPEHSHPVYVAAGYAGRPDW